MKICLVFSDGGHFTEMREIMPAFKGHDVFYVTIKSKSTENLTNTYYLKQVLGSNMIHRIISRLIFTIQSLIIVLKESPIIIVSTGAGVAVPLFYIGKLLGTKVIFIESICRINDLSLTGKIIYPIADLFLVQWEKLAKKYNRATYWGSIL